MTESWSEINWIFEPDHGTSRDIYVQETSIKDWENLIDLINSEFSVCYDLSEGQRIKRPIDKEYTLAYLNDSTGEMESKSAAIALGNIELRTHFFCIDEIELDLNPEDINTTGDVEILLRFMQRVSQKLDKQVILTQESGSNFPNIKVDSNRDFLKVLTEKELQKYVKKPSFWDRIMMLRTRFLIKFFPKYFTKRLIRSANKPHETGKSNENVW